MEVIVAGAGPGSLDLMTQEVKNAAREADLLLTSDHLLSVAKLLHPNPKVLGVMDTIRCIEERKNEVGTIVVLAVGDTGFYSIAATISRKLKGDIKVRFLPGLGSLSYFAARIGMSYEKMKLVSLHGRAGYLVPQVCYHECVFTLTGSDHPIRTLLTELCDAGLGSVCVWVGENLSLFDERILAGTAEELKGRDFSDLAVMVVRNEAAVNAHRVLQDEDFLRGKVPMTKFAIRNIAAALLDIQPSDTVYDVGAGTGAMTCTLALKASESMVYAVEQKEDALSLVRQNMKHLGIYNIQLSQGSAPEPMQDWPAPDKVFIGGSSGNLKEIVELVLEKNPAARILVTAVTMETVSEAFQIFEQMGLATSYQCINVAEAAKLGRYNLMKAENPVYLMVGEQEIEA